jgi:membrane-associated phospholipid phosphatase
MITLNPIVNYNGENMKRPVQGNRGAQNTGLIVGGLIVAAALMSFLAAKYQYFPGDLPVARTMQSLAGGRIEWARTVTSAVSAPTIYFLLAISAIFSWRLAGWRGAAIALISYYCLLTAEPWLKSMVGRPRPSPQLIGVVGTPSGYSYPSGFGLIFFSTIGWMATATWLYLRGNVRWVAVSLLSALLLIGLMARVTLGAHWPSDVLGAYLIGLAFTSMLALIASKWKR